MFANLRYENLTLNSIFDKDSKFNRDDSFDPYIQLKKSFENKKIFLNSPDINLGKKINFEIHINVQKKSDSPCNYLILLENPEVYPLNNNKFFSKYKKIFTWNDDLVDGDRFIKIQIPNKIKRNRHINSFDERNIFSALIAANKTLPKSISNNLYAERLKTVEWFDKNAKDYLEVYGSGWNYSALPHFLNRRIVKMLINAFFSSAFEKQLSPYKGLIRSKIDVLDFSKFCFCYENLSGLRGYISEKIFDCFFSGCIPVYWGASNIDSYIPKNCFIDRRKFRSEAELFEHLKSIDNKLYSHMQRSIYTFLNGRNINKFSSSFFSKKIISVILSDLAHDNY